MINYVKINRIIGISVDGFLVDFAIFAENSFSHIVDYFQGRAKQNTAIFAELEIGRA